MAQAGRLDTTRRSVFAIGAALAATTAIPAVADEALHSDLFREADEIDRLGDAINLMGATDAESRVWEERQLTFLSRVEHLPNTVQNVPIRVRALQGIYRGYPRDILDDDKTTDTRIALQVAHSLMVGA